MYMRKSCLCEIFVSFVNAAHAAANRLLSLVLYTNRLSPKDYRCLCKLPLLCFDRLWATSSRCLGPTIVSPTRKSYTSKPR